MTPVKSWWIRIGPEANGIRKNSNQKAVIDQSRNEVRKALAAIPLYYHALAQKSKDKALYQKALARYVEFSQKFPEDKWHNYEFSYYTGEIYNTLGDFDKAAQYYDNVSSADLSTFGPYKPEIDTLGMDQAEIEKEKKEEKTGPITISQEDAGYNAVVALMNARKKALASSGSVTISPLTFPKQKGYLTIFINTRRGSPRAATPRTLLSGARICITAQKCTATPVVNIKSSLIPIRNLRTPPKRYV